LLNRISRATIATLLVLLVAAMGLPGPAAASSRVPLVAIIVGPAGEVTTRYRALADEAAAAARAEGAQVVTVYSPDATWPAVRRAVEGASIIVYLGHGNGWPSPYRDALYPRTQNGFGLNPVAGVDDSAHQYFGEASIEKLRFASNAVVIFSHLCYAAGNSEPGLPEGTPEVAVQRADNYAAGFLRAGARAVVAESHLGPAYYVSAVLRGRGSIESIWAAAPSANGHTFSVASARTAGYAVRLDPHRAASGFERALVSRGVTADQVRAGAVGIPGAWGQAPAPSLASAGVKFSEPAFASLPIAGTTSRLTLPFVGKAAAVLTGTEVSVRWDTILLDPAPARPSQPTPSVGPGVSTAPGASTAPSPAITPVPAAPEVDLVVPEQIGSVVEPARAGRTASGLRLDVRYPVAPGLYRLSAMLHTPEGVAYDAATQALLTPVIVRVGGPIAAAYGAPATLTLQADSLTGVPVRVVNAGSRRWDLVETAPVSLVAGEAFVPSRTTVVPARLVATWVSADGLPVPDPISVVLDPSVAAPGGASEALLTLVAPAGAGEYLVLLDVVSPANGPLSAVGSAPAIIRVSVGEAPSPAPSPSPSPVTILPQPHR